MKKTIPYLTALCLILTVFAFVSCGEGEPSGAALPSGVAEPSGADALPEPTATAEPATEEELRGAIGTLGDQGEDLILKGKYYERLYSMDLFAEEDYIALAQVYGNQGDWERQRLMLSKVLRLYPCEEYADQVSGIVVRKDGGDERAASLAAQLMTALAGRRGREGSHRNAGMASGDAGGAGRAYEPYSVPHRDGRDSDCCGRYFFRDRLAQRYG